MLLVTLVYYINTRIYILYFGRHPGSSLLMFTESSFISGSPRHHHHKWPINRTATVSAAETAKHAYDVCTARHSGHPDSDRKLIDHSAAEKKLFEVCHKTQRVNDPS